MKWIIKSQEIIGLLAILVVWSGLTLFYYQTDKTFEFQEQWAEFVDVAVEERLESVPQNVSDPLPAVESFYRPQIIVLRNKRLTAFTNSWLKPFSRHSSVDDTRLEIRGGVNYLVREFSSSGNVDSFDVQMLFAVYFEDTKKQAVFFRKYFGEFVPTDYSFELENRKLTVIPDKTIRSAPFRNLLAYGWMIFVIISIGFLSFHIFKRREFFQKNPVQVLSLFALIIALRLIWDIPYVKEILEAIPLFVRETYFLFLTGTLGKLTFDVLLFFGFSLFLLNYPLGKYFTHRNPGLKAVFSVGLYLSIILMFIFFGKSVSQLVYFSDIQLDLEEVFNLDAYSFILLAVIMLYLFSVFILGLKIGELIIKMGIPLANRVMAAAAAALFSFPVFLSVDVNLPPFPFYLGVFIFVFLLDIFSENKKPSYPWMVLWLLILSGFGASMLFSFSLDKDLQQRELAAEVFNGDGSRGLLAFQDAYEKVKKLRIDGEGKYDYTLYQEGKKLFSTNSLYPDQLPQSWNFESDGLLLRQDRRSEWIKSPVGLGNDLQLVIGKYSADFLKPFSLFSYLFFLSAILGLILLYANSVIPIFPKAWDVRRPRARSLRRKIQLIIISLTLASLILVSMITIFFFNVNSQRELRENLFTDLLRVKTALKESYSEFSEGSTLFPKDLERQLELKVGLVNFSDGRNMDEFISLSEAGFPVFLQPAAREKIADSGPLLKKGINLDFPDKTGVVDLIHLSNGETYGIFVIPDPVYRHRSLGFTDFLSTLINVYLFLFLLSGVLAFVFADGITQPLLRLRDNLNKIRLGKDNEPLEWENDDEIGELIKDYNRIISEINEGVKFMAMTEREGAWREMAKQVAHEIKNPLTPMKLSIQHLQFASKRGHGDLNPLIERTTLTLIEQIDNLSNIASEFSTFAKMPEARNEKVNLNELVRSAHDLFRNREDMDIDLLLPIDDIFVFADKNYLIRVVTNLMKNSLQAIPMERRGKIWIKLYRQRDMGIIEVQDNGTGIPDEMRDKVFKPNFTSKSSGTGLGLAISRNIVEAFNGSIHFETERDKGTRFFVEIPLMRMEGNLEEITRVNL